MTPSPRWRRRGTIIGAVLLSGVVGVGLAAGLAPTPWALPLVPLLALAAGLAFRSPLAALATALLLAPVGLLHLTGQVKIAQALDVGVIACLALTRVAAGRTPLTSPRPLLWGWGLLAVALISTGTAVDTGLAVKQDLAIAVGLGLCAAVATVCRGRRPWLVTVRALLLGSLLVTVPAVLSGQHAQARYGSSVVSGRAQGVFAQPNELGAFAMLTALVGLGLLVGSVAGRDRWLAGASVAGALGALATSLSRGAWIGFVLGALFLLLWVPQVRRLLGGAVVIVVVTGAFLGAFAPGATQVSIVTTRLGSLANAKANPYDDRPRIWREAVREFSTRPVLGEGPGTFPVASTRSISGAATVQAEHAHDVLLTAAAETGLLGVSSLIGLTLSCAGSVRRGIGRARQRSDRQLLGVLGGLGAAMAGLIGEGTVDMTLRNVLVSQTVWVVLGLALSGAALTRAPHTDALPVTNRRRRSSASDRR